MQRGADRRRRAARGVVSAAVTVLLAGAAHTFAGGGAPSAGLLAAAAILASPVAVLLVGTRPSALRTGAAVLAAQGVFHLVFTLFGCGPTVTFSGASGAHVHAGGHLQTMTTTSAVAAHDPMTAAHALAALVTVVVVHRGERMLHAIVCGIRHLLPRRVTRMPQPVRIRGLRSFFLAPVLRAGVLAGARETRGPPLAV